MLYVFLILILLILLGTSLHSVEKQYGSSGGGCFLVILVIAVFLVLALYVRGIVDHWRASVMPSEEELLSYWAMTPWWWRLGGFYFLIGLALALYNKYRETGSAAPEAVGQTFLAALIAPVTAVKMLITYFTKPKT